MTDYTFAGFYKSDFKPIIADEIKQRALNGEFKDFINR